MTCGRHGLLPDWATGGAGLTRSRPWVCEPPCGSQTLKYRRTHVAPNQLSHRDNLLVGVGVGALAGTFSACSEQEMTCFLEDGDAIIWKMSASYSLTYVCS